MDPDTATTSATHAPSAGARLVPRRARWPGEVGMAGGRIAAIGDVPAEPGDELLGLDDLTTRYPGRRPVRLRAASEART